MRDVDQFIYFECKNDIIYTVNIEKMEFWPTLQIKFKNIILNINLISPPTEVLDISLKSSVFSMEYFMSQIQ